MRPILAYLIGPGANSIRGERSSLCLGYQAATSLYLDQAGVARRSLKRRSRGAFSWLDTKATWPSSTTPSPSFGEEQGRAWVAQLRGQPMARAAIRPTRVAILD